MNAILTELWPYFLMVLVGYLPNEVWRNSGWSLHAASMRIPKSWSGHGRLQPRFWPVSLPNWFYFQRARLLQYPCRYA